MLTGIIPTPTTRKGSNMKKVDELIIMIRRQTDDCIEWNNSRTIDGYGQVRYAGATRRAHKVAYCISNDVDYECVKGVIMHSCDNPSCINPKHLSVGSQHDNVIDCVSKGRFRSVEGLKNPKSIVTSEDSRKMLRMRTDGMTYQDIADAMGVGKSTAYRVITTGYLL